MQFISYTKPYGNTSITIKCSLYNIKWGMREEKHKNNTVYTEKNELKEKN